MTFLSWLFGKKYSTLKGMRVYHWDNILKKHYKPKFVRISDCQCVNICHNLYPKGVGISLEYVLLSMATDGISKSILHKCRFYEIENVFREISMLKPVIYGNFMSTMISNIKFTEENIFTFELRVNDIPYSVRFTNKSQLDYSDTILGPMPKEGQDPDDPSKSAILIKMMC